jgi:hypothetical protein
VRALALVLALGLPVLGAVTVPAPATAAAGELAGTWTSVDVDGSHQTLRVRGAGTPGYAVTLRDDATSGACGGPPAKLVGHGRAHEGGLLVVGTLVCLHGGNPVPGVRIVFDLEYDPADDTLTDDSGVVWERSS